MNRIVACAHPKLARTLTVCLREESTPFSRAKQCSNEVLGVAVHFTEPGSFFFSFFFPSVRLLQAKFATRILKKNNRQKRAKNHSGPGGFPEANSRSGSQYEPCQGLATRHAVSVYVAKG